MKNCIFFLIAIIFTGLFVSSNINAVRMDFLDNNSQALQPAPLNVPSNVHRSGSQNQSDPNLTSNSDGNSSRSNKLVLNKTSRQNNFLWLAVFFIIIIFIVLIIWYNKKNHKNV